MARSLEIATCSISAAPLLGVFFYRLFSRTRTDASYQDQTIYSSPIPHASEFVALCRWEPAT
jgi:hypothetical protein